MWRGVSNSVIGNCMALRTLESTSSVQTLQRRNQPRLLMKCHRGLTQMPFIWNIPSQSSPSSRPVVTRLAALLRREEESAERRLHVGHHQHACLHVCKTVQSRCAVSVGTCSHVCMCVTKLCMYAVCVKVHARMHVCYVLMKQCCCYLTRGWRDMLTDDIMKSYYFVMWLKIMSGYHKMTVIIIIILEKLSYGLTHYIILQTHLSCIVCLLS
eukprot:scpid23940/ scgid30750/ 